MNVNDRSCHAVHFLHVMQCEYCYPCVTPAITPLCPLLHHTTQRRTCVDTDEGPLGHVVQTADAPAFVLGLKELQPHLQTVLHQTVSTHLTAALTTLITLINPERGKDGEGERLVRGMSVFVAVCVVCVRLSPGGQTLLQSLLCVSSRVVDLCSRGTGCGLQGQLVT